MRAITALTAQIRASRPGDGQSFPAREAELAIRVALGELALAPELLRLPMNSQEITIAVLGELFSQWRPEPDEADRLLAVTEETVAEMETLAESDSPPEEFGPDLLPQLSRALGNWFGTGMHESPFAFGTPDVRRETGLPPWDDATLTDQARLARYDEEVAADPANVWYLTSRALILQMTGGSMRRWRTMTGPPGLILPTLGRSLAAAQISWGGTGCRRPWLSTNGHWSSIR